MAPELLPGAAAITMPAALILAARQQQIQTFKPEIVIVVPEKVTLAGMEESLGEIKKDSEEPDHFILNLTSGAAEVPAGTAPVRK